MWTSNYELYNMIAALEIVARRERKLGMTARQLARRLAETVAQSVEEQRD